MAYTFVLVHGAWHSAAHWELLQERLENIGHRTIAPALPSEDVTADFDTDTEIIAAATEGADNLFMVAHSRGAETVPRFLARTALHRVLGAAIVSSGGPYGLKLKPLYSGEPELERHTDEFDAGIEWSEDGLTTYDPERAPQVFYNCAQEEEVVKRAVHSLRRQRMPNSNLPPPLPLPPEIPVTYILGRHDRVLNLERARRVARQWLGEPPLELPTDHSPHISHPELLTNVLVQLAHQAAKRRFAIQPRP